MKVKSESEVAQLCPTLSDRMDCSLPGSSVHGIFQASVLEWSAIAFSGWSFNVIPIPVACAKKHNDRKLLFYRRYLGIFNSLVKYFT